jgi:hypothetical protein
VREGVDVTILTGRQPPTKRARTRGRRDGVIRVGPRAHVRQRRQLSSRPPIGLGAAFNFYRALRASSSTSSTSTDRATSAWRSGRLALFRGPKVLTLHNASFPDALAPRGRAVLPLGLPARRRRHRRLETTSQSMRRYAETSVRDHHPERRRRRLLAIAAQPRLRAAGDCETSCISAGSNRATGPEIAIDAFNRIGPRCPTCAC